LQEISKGSVKSRLNVIDYPASSIRHTVLKHIPHLCETEFAEEIFSAVSSGKFIVDVLADLRQVRLCDTDRYQQDKAYD